MRRTRHLKFLLLAAAVLLIVGVFWWAGPGPQQELMERLELQNKQQATSESQQLQALAQSAETVMEAPRFFGADNKGRRWEIRAHEARQKGGESGMVELHEVAAETTDTENKLITLNAVRGLYEQNTGHVDLQDGVTVLAYGHTLSTSEAQYFLEQRLLKLPQRLAIHGPMGSVEAGQGEARNNGRELSLTGGVHVHYNVTPAGESE